MNKKRSLLSSIILLSIFFQSGLAKAEEQPDVLYCPEKIECLKDKSISSCKAFGELEYWGEIQQSGTIIKGTYTLKSATSTYQDPNIYNNISCVYSNADYPHLALFINSTLDKKRNSIIWEPLLDENARWQILGYSGSCHNDGLPITHRDCPFGKKPLIKIITQDRALSSSYGISAYANGIFINKNYRGWMAGQDNQFFWTVINMYQAWDACSDTGLCTLQLMSGSEQLIDIGYIVVDMDRQMKIVHVHAISGFEITHDETLNAIEIKTIA